MKIPSEKAKKNLVSWPVEVSTEILVYSAIWYGQFDIESRN